MAHASPLKTPADSCFVHSRIDLWLCDSERIATFLQGTQTGLAHAIEVLSQPIVGLLGRVPIAEELGVQPMALVCDDI